MSCTVIVEFKAIPEKADQFRQFLHTALRDTRNYNGNLMCEELHNQDDPCNFVVFQKWSERAKQEAYLNWRGETGLMDEIGPLLEGDPIVRVFDQIPTG